MHRQVLGKSGGWQNHGDGENGERSMAKHPEGCFAPALQWLGHDHMILIMCQALVSLFAGSRSLDLRAGRVQLQRHTTNGARLILQNAGPDIVLAEASAFSEHYHCDALVTESATLAGLPKATFISALRDDPHLALAWSAMLARQRKSGQ